MLSDEVTRLINQQRIDATESQFHDMDMIYQHLKQIARGQRLKVKNAGFNTTALVNEAWIKSNNSQKTFNDRNHFFAYCALAMRHILLNEAKKNRAITYLEDTSTIENSAIAESDYLIELDRHLQKLRTFNERLEKVFTYKFFGDMEFSEIAEVLELSERTVFRDWQKAKTMLAAAMQA